MMNAIALILRLGYALLWFVALILTVIIETIFLILFYTVYILYSLIPRRW